MTVDGKSMRNNPKAMNTLLIISVILIHSSALCKQSQYLPNTQNAAQPKQQYPLQNNQANSTVAVLKSMSDTTYTGYFQLQENILNWITVREGQIYFDVGSAKQAPKNDKYSDDRSDGINLLQFVAPSKKRYKNRLNMYSIVDHNNNKNNDINEEEVEVSYYFQLSIYLLNPKYITQQALLLEFNVSSTIFDNSSNFVDEEYVNGISEQKCKIGIQNQWFCNNTAVRYTKFWKDSEIQQLNGNISYWIKINTEGGTNQQNYKIQLSVKKVAQLVESYSQIFNPQIGQYLFKSKSSLMHKDYTIRILIFCLWTGLIPLIQIFSVRPILNKLENQGIGYRMSLGSVTFCLIYDLSRAVTYGIHVYETTNLYYRFFYLIPTLMYAVLYFFFDNKIFIRTYMSKFARRDNGNPPNMKKVILISCALIIFSYEALVISQMFFIYYWWYTLIISIFIFVPQIVRNVRKGHGGDDNIMHSYVIGYLGVRYLIFFYDNSCPDNWHKIKPNALLTVLLAVMLLGQILILYFQSRISAYFFIPRIFMPKKHEYNHKITLGTIKSNEVQCCICLHNFFQKREDKLEEGSNRQLQEESSLSLNNESILEQPLVEERKELIGNKEVKVFKTPCNHMFHEGCLKSWIQVKMECPICRTVLPPI